VKGNGTRICLRCILGGKKQQERTARNSFFHYSDDKRIPGVMGETGRGRGGVKETRDEDLQQRLEGRK